MHGSWLSTIHKAVVFISVAGAPWSTQLARRVDINWKRARVGWSPQGQTEVHVSSVCLWLWCGCPAEAWTISCGAQHTHTWPRRSWGRIQGKVEQLQTCQLFHTSKVSQQLKTTCMNYKMAAASLPPSTSPVRISLAAHHTQKPIRKHAVQPSQLEHYKATTYLYWNWEEK